MDTAEGRNVEAEFTIGKAYPWGRCLDEYRRMFDLGDADLQLRILGCADGPASFNAELSARGGRVVSCDPLYAFSAAEIAARIELTRPLMIERARAAAHLFIWTDIQSPEELGAVRMRAMRAFLDDYEDGRRQGRYRAMALPALEMKEAAFDLALCSHFLFLYSDELSLEFHVASIVELCRVAAEVRVFPLLNMSGKPSRHLAGVCEALRARSFCTTVQPVSYEFQAGGNQLLRVRR